MYIFPELYMSLSETFLKEINQAVKLCTIKNLKIVIDISWVVFASNVVTICIVYVYTLALNYLLQLCL